MFYKRKRLANLHPRFFGCPSECAASGAFDPLAKAYCGDCDVKKAEDRFRAGVVQMSEKRLGAGAAKKHRFDDVVSKLYAVIALEDLPPERMSVRTRRLLDAYQTEKMRFDLIEAFNAREESG